MGKLKYPLLSDITKKISKDYDVLIEKEGIALRGTFIIDPKGMLRQITINDLPVGRSVTEILRLISALKFVEEHGEGNYAAAIYDSFIKYLISFLFSLPCRMEGR